MRLDIRRPLYFLSDCDGGGSLGPMNRMAGRS